MFVDSDIGLTHRQSSLAGLVMTRQCPRLEGTKFLHMPPEALLPVHSSHAYLLWAELAMGRDHLQRLSVGARSDPSLQALPMPEDMPCRTGGRLACRQASERALK